MKFWLCSANATHALQLDLDLLKLLEKAKTKVRDQVTIKMVEAAYVKLKDHLRYLSEHLMRLAMFSARAADRDKKEMANAILKYQNQARSDWQQLPVTEDFKAKLLKHFIGPDSWTFLNCCMGRNRHFLTKRVQKWSTEESYLPLKEIVVPIRVVNAVQRDLSG